MGFMSSTQRRQAAYIPSDEIDLSLSGNSSSRYRNKNESLLDTEYDSM